MSIRENSQSEWGRRTEKENEMEKEAERSCSIDGAILSENPLTFVMYIYENLNVENWMFFFIWVLLYVLHCPCPSNGKSIRAIFDFHMK